MQKLAFIAIKGDNGVLNYFSKKEIKILRIASNVEFRYLPELKDFFIIIVVKILIFLSIN